jgi:cytochrome c-type biogenesis protein CcsB
MKSVVTVARKILVIILSVLTLTVLGLMSAQTAKADSTEPLRYLPVQDGGRVKPLETLTRETLQLVYGRQTYLGPDGKSRPALEIVMTWMLVPTYWDTQKIVEINHRGLKDSLNVDHDQKYFSPAELFANGRLVLVMQELASYRESKRKLDPYYQAAQRLENQLGSYQAVKQGSAFKVVPPKMVAQAAAVPPGADVPSPHAAGSEIGQAIAKDQAVQAQMPPGPIMGAGGNVSQKWIAASDLDGDLKESFATLARAFVHALPSDAAKTESSKEGATDPKVARDDLQKAVDDFKAKARAQNPEAYSDDTRIAVEVHYDDFHPFMWAWIFYLLAAVTLGVAWQTQKSKPTTVGWVLALIALGLHIYGFGIRIYLTGRPPVSNMYESVVWVSFGVVMFSIIFEYLNRKKFILLAGCSIAVLCLVVADLAPTILDQSVQPLQPVLRSNMWLTIHVLTITLSYSAYFLAWGLGNIGLFFVLRGEKVTDERPRAFSHSIYRAIQVGVVLLAAGTILGGVWADYSWGRFWGWDPKETWAFIALMGYLALLHARLTGWVQNFGMLVFSVIAFNLVLMAWYGVNFVLGAGLHAYGFGAGGVEYVGAFVALDLIYVAYVVYVKSERARLDRKAKNA